MTRSLLIAAALSALSMPAHADDLVRHGTVPGTSIIWDMNSEGTYVFSNGAYGSGHLEDALVEKGGGIAGIARSVDEAEAFVTVFLR